MVTGQTVSIEWWPHDELSRPWPRVRCRTVLGASSVTLKYLVLRHAGNLESVHTCEDTAEIRTLTSGQMLTGLAALT
jgi:hypothetical protein